MAAPSFAQSLDELNIQIHGYATQGFLYTTNNNILTTTSSDGSPAWTEAVINITSQPAPKLRVSMQGRYFLLGNYGNAINLDYATADYTVNDRFGVRFGKVKTPSGLFNEIQDVDPAYNWALLPQSIYAITSRNSLLTLYGGVAYGTVNLGPKVGKFDYRGYSGQRILASSDGLFLSEVEAGKVLANGLSGAVNGFYLRWKSPLPGFSIGGAWTQSDQRVGVLTYKTYTGTETRSSIPQPEYFTQYEKKKFMAAAEYVRKPYRETIVLPGNTPQTVATPIDQVGWYAMATYKVTEKLTVGAYDSQYFSRAVARSASGSRFSKDWVISTRYDFGQFLYAKAEQHFINGTALSYDANLNPGGLKPTTKLTILKVGVSF